MHAQLLQPRIENYNDAIPKRGCCFIFKLYEIKNKLSHPWLVLLPSCSSNILLMYTTDCGVLHMIQLIARVGILEVCCKIQRVKVSGRGRSKPVHQHEKNRGISQRSFIVFNDLTVLLAGLQTGDLTLPKKLMTGYDKSGTITSGPCATYYEAIRS